MASLMENFMDILEKEHGQYERLTDLSRQKQQVIIAGNIPALEKITEQEQELTGTLINLEKKREEIVKDMSIVLSKDPSELTVTNMIAFLKDKLRNTLDEMAELNGLNESLLQHAMEMTEFDLTLFKSMRQAPTTANYDRSANNTGDILGTGGFDAKQ